MIQMHFGFSNLLQRFLHIVWYCSPSQGASFLGWFFSGTCTQSIFTLLSSVAVWLHPLLCGKSKELSPALCVKAWSTVSQRRPDVLDVKRMGEEEKLCVTLREGEEVEGGRRRRGRIRRLPSCIQVSVSQNSGEQQPDWRHQTNNSSQIK